MTRQRSRTVAVGNVVVEIVMRERCVILILKPPPNSARGWFETTLFRHAAPGAKPRPPTMKELRTIVRDAAHQPKGRKRSL